MSWCKTLVRTFIPLLEFNFQSKQWKISSIGLQHFCKIFTLSSSISRFSCFLSRNSGFSLDPHRVPSRCYNQVVVTRLKTTNFKDKSLTTSPILEVKEDDSKEDRVEQLLLKKDDITWLMKMERKPDRVLDPCNRWFPYLNKFRAEGTYLTSDEILEATDSFYTDVTKERFRNAVKNKSYSICMVVENLTDFGNVSATFRSADALGVQSVHVILRDNSKRYRDVHRVSLGAEKWLDVEIWNSTQECFNILKSRGYRIATTHLGMDSVSVYDMDWSCPTAIVLGSESRGVSDEASQLSDLHCSIPMKGMVDSFNVSVAAGILMHQAVNDRTSRLGCHGDLTVEESQILLAEFSLRHSTSAIGLAYRYAQNKRKILI